MRRIEYLELLANLFQYKTISDLKGNEYVLFADNPLNSIENVQDHTAFEAVENHVHLISNMQKDDLQTCSQIAEKIGQALLNNLHAWYPDKDFCVFVSFRYRDDMVIRFHQSWANEAPYFDPHEFINEKVYMFASRTRRTGESSVSRTGDGSMS